MQLTTLLFILTVGFIAASSPPLSAQAPAPKSTTLSGCLSRAVQNGSLTGEPGVPPATPAAAPALANSNEPTGAFLLNTATSGPESSTDRPMTFVVDGAVQELERHVGRHVEVSGPVVTVEEGAPGAKRPVSHIRVTSIKTLAPTCKSPQKK